MGNPSSLIHFFLLKSLFNHIYDSFFSTTSLLWIEFWHPPKFKCWDPTPNVMVFGGEAFGGGEVISVEHVLMGLVPLWKREQSAHSPPPGEDAARRRPSASQELSPRQMAGLAGFQNCEEYVSLFISHPVCNVFLQQPEQTQTLTYCHTIRNENQPPQRTSV